MLALIFGNRKKIRVNVKLLAGLDSIPGYDNETGIMLEIPEQTKLKKALKSIDLPRDKPISYIVNGEKAELSRKLNEGDEVFCFLPFAGG